MRDDPTVISLVARAGSGDQRAWNDIVERYSPLVWSICLRYGLRPPEVDDVGQTVWLLLVENIRRMREPAALPGWLATTTRRECLRTVRAAHRDREDLPPEDQLDADPLAPAVDQDLLDAEQNAALRAAFAELPDRCRELLSMVMAEPPPGYARISSTLGIPAGSIGPTRARCLDRLRRSPHLAAVLEADDKRIRTIGTGR
jgi:RNA polymerase sigma factor (sigma-70 family)